MKERICYKIGGHIIALTMDNELRGELDMTAYDPFKIESCSETLYEVEVVDSLDEPIIEPIIVDAPLSSSGMPQVNVYRVQSGYLYNIIMPGSSVVNAGIVVDYEKCQAKAVLGGNRWGKQLAIANAMILSYLSFAMEHSTLLLHASTVIHEGKAYLFLGKSGTGKSTHSRMWLESFEGSELLNDDHPIVRVHDDGSTIVYGSPWSGKTPCYRNLSAPIGAIVRIERALTNEAMRLRPLKAYASITTSCSGAQWSKRLMNDKVHAVEKVIQNSKSYIMKCLPNNDAARVCYNFIKEDK